MRKLENILAYYMAISIYTGIGSIILSLFNVIELSILKALLYFIVPPILIFIVLIAYSLILIKIDQKGK